MHFLEHLIITFFVGGGALLLMQAFTWQALAIMLVVTVAIDLDHVLQYIFSGRPMNLRSWMKYHMHNFKTKEQKYYAFHTLEFHVILFYLSFKSWTMSLIFFSALLHLMADQLNYYLHHNSLKDVKLWTSSWHIRERIRKRITVMRYENIHRKGKQDNREKVLWNRA